MNPINRLPLHSVFKFTLLTSALLLASCDSSDSGNDEEDAPNDGTVVVRPESSSTAGVLINVIDENGDIVQDATVFVLDDDINGDIVPDASEILQAETGSVFVPISPFEGTGVLNIEVERADFFNGGGRYELLPGENEIVDVVLTSRNVNTVGVQSTGTNGDLATGALTATVVDNQNSGEVLSSVTVPQGVQITTIDGEVLNNDLSLSVINYDATDDQALSAFPGGSFEIFIENINEVNTPFVEGTIPSESLEPVSPVVTVQTLGFVAVELTDSAGRRAENIAGNIDISMAVAPLATNPVTGNALAVGDTVALMSFNSDTARWSFEGTETIESNGNGGFEVNFSVDHLTVFTVVFQTADTCDGIVSVSVQSLDGQDIPDSAVTVLISADDGASGAGGYRQLFTVGSAPTTEDGFPRQYNLSARFSTDIPGVTIQNLTSNGTTFTNGGSFDPCAGDASFVATLDQEIDDIPVEDTVSANVTVSLECTNLDNSPVIDIPDAVVEFEGMLRNTSNTGDAAFSTTVFSDASNTFNTTITANYNAISQTRAVTAAIDGTAVPPRLIQINESFLFQSNDCSFITGGGGIVAP